MYKLPTAPKPCKFVPNEVVHEAASQLSLDEACLILQHHIGQTDGGVAGIYFCDKKEDYDSGSHWQKESLLRNYLDLEIIYEDVEPFKIEDREVPNKEFLQKDLTGRGYATKCMAVDILERNFGGEDVAELDDFVYNCEVGERWNNGYVEFTRIS
jgi:hypothetical protein